MKCKLQRAEWRLHHDRLRAPVWESLEAMTYKLVYLARRAGTVSREDWPRTWRSHAIFASQFPALEANISWLRYCSRIDQPMIDGEPVDLPQLSILHDGVAVAASPTLSGIKGGSFSPEDQAKIDEDERRVFDMLTPNFTYFATESVVKDGPLGKAALFQFLPRAHGLARQEFMDRYCGEHASAVSRAVVDVPGLSRAVLNLPVHDPLPLFPFDGISEYWFETSDDAVRAVASGALDAILELNPSLFAADGTVRMLTTVSHRWSDL
jgi:hypothetical protein